MKSLLSTGLFLITSTLMGQTLIDVQPIKLVGNLIFVEVSVNDFASPLNFLFDTGAGITVIDTEVAEKLALNITGESKIGTAGRTVVAKSSDLNTLKMGDIILLDSITLDIMDLSHISQYLRYRVDGVIGYHLLAQLIIETNITNKEIRFYAVQDYSYPGKATGIELIPLESNQFGIPSTVSPSRKAAEIELILKIDTGGEDYLSIHNSSVMEHELIDPQKRYKTVKGFGADATLSSNLKGKLFTVSFADKEWKNVPTVFEVDPLSRSSIRMADGLIGQALLLDFDITYNLPGQVVYFEKRD
jgi:predicted aspartyl protease